MILAVCHSFINTSRTRRGITIRIALSTIKRTTAIGNRAMRNTSNMSVLRRTSILRRAYGVITFNADANGNRVPIMFYTLPVGLLFNSTLLVTASSLNTCRSHEKPQQLMCVQRDLSRNTRHVPAAAVSRPVNVRMKVELFSTNSENEHSQSHMTTTRVLRKREHLMVSTQEALCPGGRADVTLRMRLR